MTLQNPAAVICLALDQWCMYCNTPRPDVKTNVTAVWTTIRLTVEPASVETPDRCLAVWLACTNVRASTIFQIFFKGWGFAPPLFYTTDQLLLFTVSHVQCQTTISAAGYCCHSEWGKKTLQRPEPYWPTSTIIKYEGFVWVNIKHTNLLFLWEHVCSQPVFQAVAQLNTQLHLWLLQGEIKEKLGGYTKTQMTAN